MPVGSCFYKTELLLKPEYDLCYITVAKNNSYSQIESFRLISTQKVTKKGKTYLKQQKHYTNSNINPIYSK